MKRAIRVCYSFWQRFWLSLSVFGICLIALILILPEQSSGIRLTEAFRLQTDTLDYQLPEPIIEADKLNGTWQPVTLPYASAPQWEKKQSPATTRLTWYRLQVPASRQLALPLYLFIPYGKSAGTRAIYADGVLVYQSHSNLQWNGSNQPRWIALPNTTQSRVPHELLIRVQHEQASGESLSSVWIGTHDELYARYAKLNFLQTQLSGVGSAAFLATGLFAFLIWLTRRSEPIYALFFLMSVSYFAASMNSYVGDNQLLLSDAWFGWLTVNSTLWMLCTFHLFLEQLHGCRRKDLTRALLISSAGMSLITVPDIAGLTNSTAITLLLYLFIVILGIGVLALGLWNSIRRQSRDGILLSGWGMLIALSGFADWLMQSSFIDMENVFLTKYASIGLVFVFWYIMLRRYVDALRTVEAAKDNLAQRLKEREVELTASHKLLREIEQRQTLSQERQRLMQDMHDGLGSSLISALRVVEHGRMDETEVAQVLQGCIDDLQLAIDSMEPVDADLLLLLATLRYRLGPRLESTGTTLHWEVKSIPKLDWLDPKNSLHILRILQEAFTNIIKHTRATDIRVATGIDNDYVMVTITDNGQGFDVEHALKSGGKGLSNQMRRAEAIGAEVKFDSNDAGTCFSLRLPIKRKPTIA